MKKAMFPLAFAVALALTLTAFRGTPGKCRVPEETCCNPCHYNCGMYNCAINPYKHCPPVGDQCTTTCHCGN